MMIYRLEPVNLDHPSWQASWVKEAVWVLAFDENSARGKVAMATLTAVPTALGAPMARSPWDLVDVTSCIPDPSRADVPSDKAITADGRTLPR
jgi:hypothetical protein